MADENRTGKDESLQNEPLQEELLTEDNFNYQDFISPKTDETLKNLYITRNGLRNTPENLPYVPVPLTEFLKFANAFHGAWGDTVENYQTYISYVTDLLAEQPEEWLDKQSVILCLEIAFDYAEAYKIGTAPSTLSEAEKIRLRTFFTEYINRQDTTTSKRKAAEEQGALIDIGNIAMIITDKNFRHALSPYRNETAYIEQLNDEFIQQLEFDKESGRISVKGQQYSMTIQELKTKRTLSELDLPLLRSIYTALYKTQTEIDTDTVTVYLPAFAKHMGIRIDTGKPNDMFAKIRSFDGCIGIMKDGRHHSFYRLLSLIKYDARANTMTFASPYMNRIYWAIKEQNTGKKNKTKELPAYSFLVHGDIASERNKKAVEIVAAIVTLIQQRGEQKPEEEKAVTAKQLKKTVTQAVNASFTLNATEQEETVKTKAHIKYRTLIETIPSLCEQLERTKTASAKNTILQRAFSKAFELLHTKTDLFTTYKNLRIDESIPTMSLLDETLCITHEGRIKKP